MNLSEIWIRRPVMTTLVMCAILFFGVISYNKLPINELPNMDFPMISVSALSPGASPENMASTVATPLEEQFATLTGLESMTSQSAEGITYITLQFALDRNIDVAAQDVNSAIAAARGDLPSDLTPPTFSKENPADQPIIYFALTSETLPLTKLQDIVDTTIVTRLGTIPGVAKVNNLSPQKAAVRIQVNPEALSNKGIGFNTVADAASSGNVSIPGGTLRGPYESYSLETNSQIKTADEFNKLIVTYQNNFPVRIQDIGKAIDSVDNTKQTAWYLTDKSVEKSIVIGIKKQPGANTVKVADAVKAAIPSLTASMPAAADMRLLFDQSLFIKESIQEVKFTLIFTIILVILVIFVFIRSLRPTLIPSIAVPLSLIATFIVMHLLDYSLNNLSLLALTLSVGFVVDDAVVMLETIIRRMEEGESAMSAALNGSKEIGFTILSMTFSLVVVFMPILFVGGILGRLFSEFAVSIAVAIVVSGFISITLTPMLCSVLLKNFSEKHGQRGWFYNMSERMFEAAVKFYGVTLKWTLHHRALVMLFTIITIMGSGYLFMIVDKGFLPSEDKNYFVGNVRAADNVAFDDMVRHMEEVNDEIRKTRDVKSTISVAGGSMENSGYMVVVLEPSEERKATIDQIMDEVRKKLSKIPGVETFLMNPPTIPMGAGSSLAQYPFTLQSTNLEDLDKYAPIMLEKIRAIPGLKDVNSDLQVARPKIRVIIDRDKASSLGLTVQQILMAFNSAYGQRKVSTIYGATSQYPVYMEVDPAFKVGPDSLSTLYIKSATNKLVPLSTIAKFEETTAPVTVKHLGKIPSATISYNLAPGTSLGVATAAIDKIAKETLPQSVTAAATGEASAFASTFSNLGFLLFVSIIVIYLVLGILYESFIHPITILSALPLAGFGALGALVLFHKELDMYSFVGIIMLVGLVKKNGIMMIDYAVEVERTENLSAEESIYKACVIRFRPIMMTTLAALLGTMPIALATGAGAASRQPMGIAVVGGLFFSQMLTLYVTPVFYIYMDNLSHWRWRKKAVAEEAIKEI